MAASESDRCSIRTIWTLLIVSDDGFECRAPSSVKPQQHRQLRRDVCEAASSSTSELESAMERESFDRYIEPPPRLVASAEALPHLGGLALAPYRGELPDEIELHAVEPLRNTFDDATRQEILKRALGVQKIRERLNRGRCLPIGISRRGEEAKGERRTYLVVAYDYSADVTVEMTLDDQGELLGINDERYQPPPIESEIEHAIDLARSDSRLASRIEGLAASAIPFSGPNNEFANRRVLEVLFGCRADRLPKYRAWVDLSKETVLHAGGTCECCGDRQEAQS
jgi:hypothetical protein